MTDRITIFDTTLRDGEQAPGASMTVPEKLEIAHLLGRMGVDVIEAGFPISSPIQVEGVSRVAAEVEGPIICALARTTEKDVKAAADALSAGKKTRIHTFIATSDIHIDGKFGDDRYGRTLKEKRRTILKMAVEAVQYARTFTDDVEFSAEDAGRTAPAYLCEIINAVVEAGATTINIPDTTGYCMPDEYSRIIATVRDKCLQGRNVVLSVHCHDDLGIAVANSLAGVAAGGRQIECTINGIGERAGNASLEEVVMALRVRKDHFGGLDTGIDARQLTAASKLVSTYSGFPVQPNKAIVGRNAFRHEAGIHQDGVLKRADTYEIMRAEDVGQDGEGIRLGRHSGRHGLFSRLERLGYSVSDDESDEVYRRFVVLADSKKEIYDEDLMHLVGMVNLANPVQHYVLDSMEVVVTTSNQPQATVCIRMGKSEEVRCQKATGDGPVDAIYRAIEHAVGSPYELKSYTIRSVTEGQDALGEVTVRVEFAGKFFSGRGTSTDILRASAEAYIDALNHIETHRMSDEYVIGAIVDSYRYGTEGGW
ncbi:MAG TPA: 2-isopropylmalate synthase [Rhodothermales bacterium]|nr:2-isopropylmalate synthase [Rhodothermales bacterium]